MEVVQCFFRILALAGWVAFGIGVLSWMKNLGQRLEQIEDEIFERADATKECAYGSDDLPNRGMPG